MSATILIPIDEINILVSGVPITDLPVTGQYLTIEKLSATSTPTEGLNGVLSHSTANGKAYRVTLNVIQWSDSDVILKAAHDVALVTNSVLVFSYTVKLISYVSANCRIEGEPTRSLAADGSENISYTMVGTFPLAAMGGFGVPSTVDADQIAAQVASLG